MSTSSSEEPVDLLPDTQRLLHGCDGENVLVGGDKPVSRGFVTRDKCAEGRQSGHTGKERGTRCGAVRGQGPQSARKLTQAGGGEGLSWSPRAGPAAPEPEPSRLTVNS